MSKRTMSRVDVLRKCLIVFEAIKRHASRGEAGFEPQPGMEESYFTDDEICRTLREMIWDIQRGEKKKKTEPQGERDWQQEIMEHGAPERLTFDEN